MAYQQIPTRTSADSNSAADVNQGQDNDDELKGGTPASAPTKTVEGNLAIVDLDDAAANDANTAVTSQLIYKMSGQDSDWLKQVVDSTYRALTSPSSGTWQNYSGNVLSLSAGTWKIYYYVSLVSVASASGIHTLKACISDANNTEGISSSKDYTATKTKLLDLNAGSYYMWEMLTKECIITLSSSDDLYLNVLYTGSNGTSFYLDNATGPSIFRAQRMY